MSQMLLFSVFVIATCGLIYELIAGTAASYLLGDSVTQFSTVIGTYLFAMGIGSYLSKFLHKHLLTTFIQVELLIGVVGGCSATILFMAFAWVESFQVLLYSLVSMIGILVGLEIPLLMRILKSEFQFKELVSNIFTFDYIGALFASLLFPLFLVPHLGLIRSAFLFGILNALVAVWAIHLFRDQLPVYRYIRWPAYTIVLGLTVGFIYSENLMSMAEATTYPDRVIYSASSPYQRIVLTRNDDDIRLFLNGNLQFSSRDEYRYHEALVHVGMASLDTPKNVLVLGGGDGMAVRELLKYSSVENITLVDLDAKMTAMFSGHDLLKRLNDNAFHSSKVKIIHQDAFVWLRKNRQLFDFIVMDFPDPGNYSVGKLYTDTFFRTMKTALAPEGLGVIQSTSPYYAKKSFWCVVTTLQSVGLNTLPYHAYVPSFGDWGYVLVGKRPVILGHHYPEGLRYITPNLRESLTTFPEDMKAEVHEVNRLNNQTLVRLFEEEWSRYVSTH